MDATAQLHGVALALARGVGPVAWRARVAQHVTPSAAFEATVHGVDRADAVAAATRALSDAQRAGARLLLASEREYPASLRELPDPPPFLFALGDLAVLERPLVAIVGTRHPTRYGERMAQALGRAVVLAGGGVVSGMAMGIDAIAHQAALEGGGGTIAVLASGVDVAYPPRHRALHAEIAAQGVILSEAPCGRPPVSGSFPRRNRVIAAIARVTIVVEAGLRSGALITAGVAVDLARTVAAVPGPIDASQSAGTNELLRDGAQVIASIDDAIALAGLSAPRRPRQGDDVARVGPERSAAKHVRRTGAAAPPTATDALGALAATRLGHEERLVWDALNGGPAAIEALVSRVHLEPRRCLAAVTTLELEGLIAADVTGMIYRL